MIKEIDPKEPIEFAWNAFVDEMGDRKWGATDAFKWAWKEARKQEREACAKIAENKVSKTWSAPHSPKEWWELASQTIALEIRERGQE